MLSKKTTRLVAAAFAAMFVGTTASEVVMAQGRDRRDDFMLRYYKNNRHDDDYRRWRAGRWSDSDYRRWYRNRHREDRFSGRDAATAAIFGLAVGGLLGGVTGGALRPTGPAVVPTGRVPPAGGYAAFTPGYMRYCSNKFRSFDPNSGTFVTYGGQRQYCR